MIAFTQGAEAMAKVGKWKLGLGIGCGLAMLIVLGILGTATWYTGRINAEYKEVRESEKALLAATESEQGFRPPPGGVPTADRLEAFLAVRGELAEWRRIMATASGEFAVDRQRQRSGGLKDLVNLVNTGSDLMPTYAGFWVARNEALLDQGMGPHEYSFIYRLVYHTWLGFGRPPAVVDDYPADILAKALGPYRERLISAFDATVDPVELIFQGDGP
jgi:hypothetical protein